MRKTQHYERLEDLEKTKTCLCSLCHHWMGMILFYHPSRLLFYFFKLRMYRTASFSGPLLPSLCGENQAHDCDTNNVPHVNDQALIAARSQVLGSNTYIRFRFGLNLWQKQTQYILIQNFINDLLLPWMQSFFKCVFWIITLLLDEAPPNLFRSISL